MSNCQESSGVSPDATQPSNDVNVSSWRCTNPPLPDRARWPETRRALVLWTQEHLDRELALLPRREWFDKAIAMHLVHDNDQERDALTKANDAMFERIRERSR